MAKRMCTKMAIYSVEGKSDSWPLFEDGKGIIGVFSYMQ
jgi:hypothetical protein